MPENDGDSVESNFATNLRVIRDDRGMSQEQLAEAMSSRGHKWHQATVYKVETGSRQVSISEADALSRIFGVGIGTLTGAPESARTTAVVVRRYQALQEARKRFRDAENLWYVRQGELKYTIEEGDASAAKVFGVEYLPGALDRFSAQVANEIKAAIRETAQDVISEPPF